MPEKKGAAEVAAKDTKQTDLTLEGDDTFEEFASHGMLSEVDKLYFWPWRGLAVHVCGGCSHTQHNWMYLQLLLAAHTHRQCLCMPAF